MHRRKCLDRAAQGVFVCVCVCVLFCADDHGSMDECDVCVGQAMEMFSSTVQLIRLMCRIGVEAKRHL